MTQEQLAYIVDRSPRTIMYNENDGQHPSLNTFYQMVAKMVRNKQNTPGIIKYPFWQMTYQNPKAVYACVNLGEAVAPWEIKERSICIDRDIGEVLECL